MQKEDLRRVMDLLFLREHHARTLLIHHRWDVEKLFAVLVEKGRAFLFAEAGVTLVEHQDNEPLLPSSTIMCAICMEDVPSDEATKMDCGHCFCNSCKYLPIICTFLSYYSSFFLWRHTIINMYLLSHQNGIC